MKTIKTGTVWALLAALLLLSAKVEASTVFFVLNSTVTTGQNFSLDLIGTGFTGIVDGSGVNLSFYSSVPSVKNSKKHQL